MNNSSRITEEQTEAIAAQYGDEIRWRSEINLPNIPITFPVTEKDFLAYQEQLAGCKLPHDVRETIAAWVPIINTAYTDGLSDSTVAELDSFVAQHPAGSPVALFLEKVKLWMEYAAEQQSK